MADEELAINLKVLSPSAEVEGGVNLPDLPASTTVKELRGRIHDAIPSKPSTDRMRLIYRGRVVANDADTLSHVFGVENIRESKEQSLHLVLRELPPSGTSSSPPVSRSSTAPPNPFRPAQATAPAGPSLQTNPFRTLPQPRPNSQPQLPPHHHTHPHPHVHHNHIPGQPHNPFQIPLPQVIQQHLAQAMATRPGEPTNNVQPPEEQGEGRTATAPGPGHSQPGVSAGLPPLTGFAMQSGPPNGRTVRQEGIGPNGERWIVTYSSTSVPIGAHGPQAHASAPIVAAIPTVGPVAMAALQPPANDARTRLLSQLRQFIQHAMQEMANVMTLLQSPTPEDTSISGLPAWRIDRMRQHIREAEHNIALFDRGVEALGAQTSHDPSVLALRLAAAETRLNLSQLSNTLTARGFSQTRSVQNGASLGQPSSNVTPAALLALSTPGTNATSPQSLPAGLPEELFLLSSPQGPVGILYSQQGTYMTTPMTSTLPFQTFTEQFSRNRQTIAGLGQHIAHGSSLRPNVANVQPGPTNAQPEIHNGGQQQPQAQLQQQDQAQNPNPNVAQPVAPAENDRIGNIAGHLWLLFKLACFVYFFSGGGGWYKSVMLGLIAGGVYLAQLGIFDEYFNIVRRHFEAVLPMGALADRALQNRNANNQAPVTDPARVLTPEEAARRLLQQRHIQRFGWVRESMRTVERSVAIFVASLWPGIGERMVHAQEERERLQRVAEQERIQRAEEAARQEAEAREQQAQQSDEKTREVVADEQLGESTSSKGKERADAAEDSPAVASSS